MVVAYVYKTSTRNVEAGGSQVEGYPVLQETLQFEVKFSKMLS